MGIDSTKKFQQYFILGCKIFIILVVCSLSVYLLPRSGIFQYEFQNGTPWRYETLYAPFDFPIYKTDTELVKERQKIINANIPMFVFDYSIGDLQSEVFFEKIKAFRTKGNAQALVNIAKTFSSIYEAGIIQLPEEFENKRMKTIKVIRNNVSTETDINTLFTLKTAYSYFTNFVKSSNLSTETKHHILNIDLNSLFKDNLKFDTKKTKLELNQELKNINPTQGMVHNGDLIISKRELVTLEKIKILDSLQKEYRHNYGDQDTRLRLVGGQIMLILMAIIIFCVLLYYTNKKRFSDFQSFIFLFLGLMTTIGIAAFGYYQNVNMLALPILFFVIMVNILLDRQSAVYLLLTSSIIASYFSSNSYMFMFMQMSAGIVAIYTLSQLERRAQLFLSITLVYATYAIIYLAFLLVQEEAISTSNLYGFFWLFINSVLLSLTYPLLYLFERVFGFISEITFIELSTSNHPALRSLTQKAPGTFQHSMIVANLAEEAAFRVGANTLLTRTGALYHDIGKIENPIFFIENQSGSFKPHSEYTYMESARIIIDHVQHGVEIAEKYNLPQAIIDIIRSHHGCSKVRYFYNSYKNQHPDEEIDESAFTYPGPDPTTKECAIIMMADTVEAASRSLPEKTEENLSKLVDDLISAQIREGRFNNADITFKDISLIKSVFIEMLTNIYHSRIAYPKLKKK